MTVTAAQFRANFPEFANTNQYPPGVVDFWLAAADLMLSTTRWGRVRDLAVQLFTAHNLVFERQAQQAAAAGGVPGIASGPVQSKQVGPAHIAYDSQGAVDPEAGHWNTTTYGQRLWRMIQIFGAGPIQIGIGVAPVGINSPWFNGGAWPGPSPWPLPSGTGFSS